MKTFYCKILLIITLCLAGFDICSAADITYYPKFRADDSNGEPMAFGQVYSYVPGTTTPKATYTSSTGDVANSNPVVLDNKGEADIYTVGPTKLVLKKKVGSFYVTQWEETVEGSGAIFGNYKYPDYEASDQGAADATYTTVKDIIDGLAADEEATIFFPHNSGGVTTAYTFLTAETIPENVTLEFEHGAVLEINNTKTVTFTGGPNVIVAEDDQLIFNDLNTDHDGIIFSTGGRLSAGWWYDGGGNITKAWQTSKNSVDGVDNIIMIVPAGTYTVDQYSGGDGGAGAFRDASNILVKGWGATFVSGISTVKHLEVQNCNNFRAEGFTFDGDNDTHTIASGVPKGVLVDLAGCTEATVANCYMVDSCSDGIIIQTSASDADFRALSNRVVDCVIDNATRNGISVTGAASTLISSCKIINVGVDAQANPPFAAIDLETNSDIVINTTIDSCFIDNCLYGIREVDGAKGSVDNVTIRNTWILSDLDNASANYGIFTEDSTTGWVVDNCYIQGPIWFNGDNLSIVNGTQLVATDTDAGSPLRYLGAAGGNMAIRDSKIIMDGKGTKGMKFISTSARTDAAIFVIENNTFSLIGDMAGGSEDLLNLASPLAGEKWFWKSNTFETTSTTTVHHLPMGSSHFISYNNFDQYLTPGIGPDTSSSSSSYADFVLGAESLLGSVRQRLPLAGASVSITNGLVANSMLLGSKAEIVSGGTITYGGGGTSWQVGYSGDPDAFGLKAVNTPGAQLLTQDWTYTFRAQSGLGSSGMGGANSDLIVPIMVTGNNDITITPDVGTFSGGTVEVIIYYMRTR